MKKQIILLVSLFVLAACASLPEPRQIQDAWTLDKPFDIVWQSVLETLAEINIAVIVPVQKDSGLITTEMATFPKNDEGYWDCGSLSFSQTCKGHRGRITVFVTKTGETQTGLKIVAKFETLFTDTLDSFGKSRIEQAVQGETLFARPCISTGKIEAEIFSLISGKGK